MARSPSWEAQHRGRILHAQPDEQLHRYGRARRRTPWCIELASIFDLYWNSPRPIRWMPSSADHADRDEALKTFDHLVDDGRANDGRSPWLPSTSSARSRSAPTSIPDVSGSSGVRRLPLPISPARSVATSRRNGAIDERADERHGSGDGIAERGRHFFPVLHPRDDGCSGVRRLENAQSSRSPSSPTLLAANDEPLTHTGYARYRVRLAADRCRPL